MAQNINPVFPLKGNINFATLTAANTAKDGTGTVATICTAPVDGTYSSKIVCRSLGTNVASVIRVFINNGGATTTAANNTLYTEASLPATTITEVASQSPIEIPMNIVLPATYRITVVLGTAVAAGWAITSIAADYG